LLTFALFIALLALAYCLYRIRKLKADVALAVGMSTPFLEYITEQRGALLYLVIDALKNGADPPSKASTLEIKVARILMSSPKSREELDLIWNWQPQGGCAPNGNQP
jgi:hypothetical protein